MKALTTIILSIILCTSVYSQEESKEQKYALSFGIGNNFTLTNFNMDIAVKRILDDSRQIRLFLSPRFSSGRTEGVTNTNTSSSENTNVSYTFGLGVDHLWRLASKKEFNMYGGGGVAGYYGNDGDNEVILKYPTGSTNFSGSNSPFWSVAIRGILGVEWKVSEGIGIHSEYVLYLSYQWRKTETTTSVGTLRPSVNTSKSTRVGLISNALFGISIYL